jgi:hypothetical protein
MAPEHCEGDLARLTDAVEGEKDTLTTEGGCIQPYNLGRVVSSPPPLLGATIASEVSALGSTHGELAKRPLAE